jgi:hypothetical protein
LSTVLRSVSDASPSPESSAVPPSMYSAAGLLAEIEY